MASPPSVRALVRSVFVVSISTDRPVAYMPSFSRDTLFRLSYPLHLAFYPSLDLERTSEYPSLHSILYHAPHSVQKLSYIKGTQLVYFSILQHTHHSHKYTVSTRASKQVSKQGNCTCRG